MPRLALVTVVLLSAVLGMRNRGLGDSLAHSYAAREQARVRAHLDSAEREVRAAPVTGLMVSQRAARARALDRLHAYWVRGVFPKNTDFPGKLVPYFIDRTGTRCAMAHLIEQSGSGDFVARVAETNNNARVPELRNDPELVAWLDANGLTLQEAARIQPAYCGLPPEQQLIPCQEPVPAVASAGYKTTTGLSVGADVLAVALNGLRTPLSWKATGALGIASGVLGIAVGSANFDQSGTRRTLGFVNAGAGAVSAALGLYRFASKPTPAARVTVGPLLGAGSTAGFRAHVTF
jgi:hypothetical protein